MRALKMGNTLTIDWIGSYIKSFFYKDIYQVAVHMLQNVESGDLRYLDGKSG
jgi:hypothetical protein